MMDVPTANQSQTPCLPWAGQNGWSSAGGEGPACTPLLGFQHLSLGSSSDQRPCLGQLQVSNQSFQSNITAVTSGSDTHHNALSPHNAHQTVQQIMPDARVSSAVASQGRKMPPSSLPHLSEGMQHYMTHQVPLSSNHGLYHTISSPFQPSNILPDVQNGPPHEEHLPTGSPISGQYLHQTPVCPHQPTLSKANMESSVAYMQNPASPTSSIPQQLPPWSLPPHAVGNINISNSAKQDSTSTLQSPSSESRYGLDPKLLPSVVKVLADDRAEWEGKVFVSAPLSPLPPMATSSCIMEDRGNASPDAIRSTSYCVPCDGQTALLSRLPLGALVTPLAKQNAGEPLPVCKESDCVMGCGWCGAFMCPAMGWQDCGQRFYCPFCGKLNEVPWQHYQPTKGVEGVRVDKDIRPELCKGSYEILNSHKSEPVALLLAIDVSAAALRGGHLEFAVQQILALLNALMGQDDEALSDVRVGVITYDSKIHLYDLHPALSRPHMLVITETEDLQLPVREGLLVPLKDCIHSIESVLQFIPQFSPDCEDCGGVPVELPVKAGLAILQALACPGKLLIFHTAPPIEMGHTNSFSGFFGSNKPKSIFQPSELAVSLAKECVNQGCGIHMFVLSQQDVGGAWPGHIPYLTGGALHTYGYLQGELDRERFSTDLKNTVEMSTAFKADLRIFVSKDLRVSGCYGLFIPGPNPRQVAMATLNRFTTLAVELAHTRALDETRGVAIQTVLSYSTQTGDRRTRVHTLTLQCSPHLQDTFRHYQAQALLTFYCKKMYCAVLERPLQELREELQTDVTEALAAYRKHCCSASVSTGQLVLPQCLRALPIYINSLRKSEVLLPGLRTSIPQRLQQRCQVLSMDTCSISTHFYPLLLPLPISVASLNSPNPEEALRCCAASLEPTGLYLVHAPLTLLLWVGSQVPACTLVELFNTNGFLSLPSGEISLPVLENPLSVSVRSLVNRLNSWVPCGRKLQVVKQGDTCEEALQRHLVEDKSPNGGASYADFLYHVHVNSVRLLQ